MLCSVIDPVYFRWHELQNFAIIFVSISNKENLEVASCSVHSYFQFKSQTINVSLVSSRKRSVTVLYAGMLQLFLNVVILRRVNFKTDNRNATRLHFSDSISYLRNRQNKANSIISQNQKVLNESSKKSVVKLLPVRLLIFIYLFIFNTHS